MCSFNVVLLQENGETEKVKETKALLVVCIKENVLIMLLCRYEKQLSTIKELQEKLERLTNILQSRS